jgi:SAM-dependent methyltransferase
VDASEYERMFALEREHWRYRGVRSLVRGAIARELGARRGRVLDAGCGSGFGAVDLGAVADVVAVDLHPLALAYCRERGLRACARADVQRLPFEEGSFDAVVSVDVLYHRAVRDDAAALAELGRVVRPGGVVVLLLAAYEWLRGAHDAVVHTERRYTKGRVRRIAQAAGLAPEHLSYFIAAPLPLVAAARWLRPVHGRPRSDLTRPPAALNGVLAAWLALEAALARRVALPFGLSVFAVLRRPAAAGADETD